MVQLINSKQAFDAFEKEYRQKYNSRSLVGAQLKNANGDIDLSGLGYQYTMDSLTYIIKKVVEQKFYTVPFADFVPVVVGEGSFSQNLLQNISISTSGDFEEGDINQAEGNSRLASVDASVSPVTRVVKNWAKAMTYNVIEFEQAIRAMNWDIIEARVKARKKNWDLGMQSMAFLGHSTDANVKGLHTLAGVNINTALITKTISSMTAAEFSVFVAGIISAYLSNCNRTAMPNTFLMPLADYVGLSAPVSSDYPLISKKKYLEDAFASVIDGGVEIKGVAYGEAAVNTARGVNKARYVLYRNDEDTIRMDIPVDLTVTQPNTLDNFNFQNAGYGQYTGVVALRPLEVLYFDY